MAQPLLETSGRMAPTAFSMILPPPSTDGIDADRAAQAYLEASLARLRSAGLRITRPRVKLLTQLSRSEAPMTVEELHRAAGTSDCDLVTVYRCLLTFENHDVVRRTYRQGGAVLYERKLGEPPRYRIVCRQTNEVEEIDAHAALHLEEAIRTVESTLRERGFEQVSHVLEFFGVKRRRVTSGQVRAAD